MKTRKLRLLNSCLLLILCTIFSVGAQEYDWKRVKIGAGGWVTGMDIQQNGRYAYCRTDVGGAYRLDLQNSNSDWVQLLSVTSMPANKIALGSAFVPDETRSFQGVASIRSAASDENRVYMMYNRILYRSNNKGDTWQPTSLNIFTVANESNVNSKLIGERITVDPVNKDVVYYGSNQDGLYRTTDAGANWSRVGGVPTGTGPLGISGIEVDLSTSTVNGRKSIIYAAVYDVGIYRSTDGGSSWSKTPGSPANAKITDTDIGSDGTFYYTTQDGGIFRFKNGTWTSLPSPAGQLNDVSVDPFDPNKVLVTAISGTVYSSTDQGSSGWTATNEEKSVTANDIPWLQYADDENFLSVGELIHDPQVNGKIWLSHGTGIFFADYTAGETQVDWFSRSAGIEELICKDVIKAPGQKLVQLSMDRPIFVIEDADEYPVRHFPDDQFQSAWDGDYCAAQPEFMAVILTNENFFKEHEASGWSADGGRTWNRFASMPNWPGKKDQNILEQGYGSIAVSSTDPNNILMNNTGLFTGIPESQQNLTNLYYTTDRGNSWQKSTGVPEKDGFPVRFHNRKNVCADAVTPNTFYYYHWREGGLFKSTDKGKSFNKVNSTLPTTAYHPTLKPVFGKEGHVLWTEGYDGDSPLYLSTDGGSTFESITGDNVVFEFGLGKALNDYPTIFVQGRFNGQEGYFRSTDRGASWQQIGTYPLDTYGTVGGMDGDKEVFGKVYVGTESFGVFSGTGEGVQEEVAVDSISVSPEDANLEIGKTLQLDKTVLPINATNKSVTWSSNDTAIAKVDANGKVTGVAKGDAQITATTQDGNKSATANITVVSEPSGGTEANFGFETGDLSGWTTQGNPGIQPWAARTGDFGATLTGVSDELSKEVTGLSPNTLYSLEVWTYIDGASGALSVTASDYGGSPSSSDVNTTLSWTKTTVGFTTGNSNTSAKITLKAAAMPSGWIWLDDISINSQGASAVLPTGVTAVPNTVELTPGSEQQLEINVLPDNATDKSVNYTSSNVSVATVDSGGNILALSPGIAQITIKTNSGSGETSVPVTVSDANTSNLVQNPGFEDATPLAEWGTYNSVRQVGDSNSGQSAVRMGGSDTSDGYLTQVVQDLEPNTTYTLSLTTKMNIGNVMFAGVNRTGDDQQIQVINTDWAENSLSFTMGANNTEAEVYIWIAAGQSGLADDFELVAGSGASSAAKLTEGSKIRIYPNSTKGDFTVSLGNTDRKRSVQIFDFQGRSVFQGSVSESKLDLNTSELGLAPGIYMVRVADGSKGEIKKLVVE